MRRSALVSALVFFGAPLAAQAPPVVFEDLRLLGPDECLTAFQGDFGWSVALDRDLLLVGCADYVLLGGDDPGAVYVYRRQPDDGDDEVWVLEARLDAPEGAVAFGYDVSLARPSGGEEGEALALVTAKGDDGAVHPGRAFVFRRTPDGQGGFSWALEGEVGPPAGVSAGRYGEDAALGVTPGGEAVALVGAPLTANGGAVAVFRREGDGGGGYGWAEEAVLRVDALEAGDFFGGAVAFDGSRALVGAVAFDALSFDADTWLGAAWVLRRVGSGGSAAWVEEDGLVPDEPEEELRGDRYARSVAIDGAWAAVGAPYDSNDGDSTIEWDGATHVFRRDGVGNWELTCSGFPGHLV
jgi:hypothetical protein